MFQSIQTPADYLHQHLDKQQEKKEFYVLTGGPCSGKTTLIKLLEREGYAIGSECARELITSESKKHEETQTGVLPWTDFLGFQKLLAQKQHAREVELPKRSFLDRSLIDAVGYCNAFGHETPSELTSLVIRAIAQERYKHVFLLHAVAYTKDNERLEDQETARRIHKALLDTYTNFGYDVIHVPDLGSPLMRLEHIKEYLPKRVH